MANQHVPVNSYEKILSRNNFLTFAVSLKSLTQRYKKLNNEFLANLSDPIETRDSNTKIHISSTYI